MTVIMQYDLDMQTRDQSPIPETFLNQNIKDLGNVTDFSWITSKVKSNFRIAALGQSPMGLGTKLERSQERVQKVVNIIICRRKGDN